MTFIDLFSGVGGFREGMERAGHECIGFCEADKYATASYTSMHLITDEQRGYLSTLDKRKRLKEILKEEYRNGEWYSNDIRTVTGDSIPKADCWCGGFCCQDISVAGKQAGLDGERSGLFFEIIRILEEQKEEDRPEWLILENVKALLSINQGWDFARVLIALDEVGFDCEWFLFNSKYHGVPQNRERVYIVGHLRSRGSSKVFYFKGTSGEDSVSIELIGHRKSFRRNLQTFSPYGITETLDTAGGGGRGHYVAIPVITPDRINKRQNGRRFKEDGDVAFTLTSQDRHGVAIGVNISANVVSENNGISHCLNANDQRKVFGANQERTMAAVCIDTESDKKHPGMYVELYEGCIVYAVWYEKYQCYIAIRKLLPIECFRLQGWNDEKFYRAEFVNSDCQLYKQSGNGVTVSVVKVIADKLKEIETNV